MEPFRCLKNQMARPIATANHKPHLRRARPFHLGTDYRINHLIPRSVASPRIAEKGRWSHSTFPSSNIKIRCNRARPVRNLLSCTSRSISEPLTLGLLQSNCGTAHVINSKLLAVGIAEIKFGQIALQVLFAALLIGAD